MKSNQVSPVKLQPPGAGIPLPQLIFLKVWLGPFVAKRAPQAKSRKTYEMVTGKLVDLVSGIPEQQRQKKVLIEPMAGIEDSSRFWSANDVLEHLLIVSRRMEKVILTLASGKIPDGVADTAAVKPGNADHDLLQEFKDYAPGLMDRIDRELARPGMNLFNPTEKFRHPWFGGFTARQWYWLLGAHQGLHYKQAKKIRAGL
jgi:hypothetical protein